MLALIVPTINSNDSDALLQEWLKADGAEVQQGDTLAVLETTKATFELDADAGGLLHIAAQAGGRYAYGATLGWIFTDQAERDQFFLARTEERSRAAGTGLVMTRAAEEFAKRHGIDEERIRALGKKVIKASDLEALVGAASSESAGECSIGGEPLPAQQQSIARVVSRSRSTIPDSFLLKKIWVDAALIALGDFSREQKALAGLPDLLVWIVSRLPAEFKYFFGALRDDLTFVSSAAGNIGVTFDVGHGLFIPVIRETAKMSLKEVAKQMMQFRMRAARNQFRAEDLAGGDVSISLNMDADILCVMPVILPPQTCMLSVSAVLSEVVLEEGGKPVNRKYLQLGLAYDHRAINGFAANAFLNAIKSRMERPEPETW